MCPAGIIFLVLVAAGAMGWLVFDMITSTARRAAAPVAVRQPPVTETPPHFSPKERAEELLLRLLSPSQKTEYERHGHITVPITLPGSYYASARIGKGTRGVIWIPQQSSTRGNTDQCVYVENVPDKLVKEDDLISKLLWLRADPVGLAKVSGMQLASRLMWFSSPPHAI